MAEDWILSKEVSSERIEKAVLEAVANALDLETDEVSLENSLQQDLGAESLDYLDIAFTLEREFKVVLPRADLLQRAGEHFGEEALVKEGVVTDLGLELLRQGMPELDPGELQPGLRAAFVPALFTVNTFVRLVHRLLASKEQMSRICPDCGGALEDSAILPEVVCADCGKNLPIPTGDEVIFGDLLALQEEAGVPLGPPDGEKVEAEA